MQKAILYDVLTKCLKACDAKMSRPTENTEEH